MTNAILVVRRGFTSVVTTLLILSTTAGELVPVIVNGGKPYDLGLTVARPDSQVNIDRRSLAVCLSKVPCEEYQRAWVTCAVDPNPTKDPAFVVRLTRYVTAPINHYKGRAYSAMANTLVELASARKTQLGLVSLGGKKVPLWRVEVPLETGDIQDLVFSDDRGDFMEDGRYLDLELLGRTNAFRVPDCDPRHNADRHYTSGVIVYGVELEKPSVEMEMLPIEPGNIFHNDEKPETRVALRVREPGDYTLDWTIADADGKVVSRESLGFSRTATNTIALANAGEGWYSLDWTLRKGARTLLKHKAAFALLGRDTRTTGAGDGYGVWSPFSWHYRCDPKTPEGREIGLKLVHKAGFRRMTNCSRWIPLEERRRWKVADYMVTALLHDWRDCDKDDEKLKRLIAKRCRENPQCKAAMLFWENYSPYYGRQATECRGGAPDTNRVVQGFAETVTNGMRLARLVRDNFPDLKIMVGNHGSSSHQISALIRNGFPEAYADYMGIECYNETVLPEMQTAGSLQGVECMRDTARHYGYRWGLDSCAESYSRSDSLLGADRQASWYVRDLLLSLCWRMPDICVGDMVAAGTHYEITKWGMSSLCTRMPFVYPKKAYVALATATKFLEKVSDREILETGDKTVYAVRCTCQGGRQATVFWTSRGSADLKVETAGACAWFDLYGRSLPMDATVRTVGEAPVYLLSEKPCVTSVKTLCRAYPDTPVPEDFQVVVKADDAEEWTVSPGPERGVESGVDSSDWPTRIAGKGVVRQVTDEEKGAAIELELVEPNLALKPIVQEYMFARLKRPVGGASPFASVGAWIKGNSGWGEVFFVLKDADGRRTISCSTHLQGKLDYDGRQVMCYSGWNFISFPVLQTSSIREISRGIVSWNWTDGSPVRFPVQIEGLVFSARSRPLFLSETATEPYRQVVRIRDIGVFDLNHAVEAPDCRPSYELTVGKIDLVAPAIGSRDVDFNNVVLSWTGKQDPPFDIKVSKIPSGEVVFERKGVKEKTVSAVGFEPGTIYAWSVFARPNSLAEGTFQTVRKTLNKKGGKK